MLARRDVDEGSARDGHCRARDAQHEAVVSRGRDGPVQVELHPSRCAGRDLVAVEHDDAAPDLHGPGVQKQLRAMTDGLGRRRENADRRVDAARRLDAVGQREDVAADEVLLIHADQVGRDSAAGADLLDLLVVALQPAHADEASARDDLHLVPHADRTVTRPFASGRSRVRSTCRSRSRSTMSL